MNDLVERLRDAAIYGPIPCPVCDEAADTIERLQAELVALKQVGEPVAWLDTKRNLAFTKQLEPSDVPLYASPTPTDRDAERLDWLDAQNERKNKHHGTKYGWKYSENCNRIALEDHGYPVMTVREAIDAAMQEGK